MACYFGVLIKLNVGNFGSEVLYPVLKDVPVVNMILPEPAQNQSDTSTSKEYDNLTEANARIKELESQLAANKMLAVPTRVKCPICRRKLTD